MTTWLRRLQYVVRRRRIEADLAEEIESHRAARQAALEAAGLSAAEAAAESRRVLGNVMLAREDARGVWIWPGLESVWQDARLGLRALAARPGLTAIAMLTMAVGIGTNTSVFSLIDASLLRRLPIHQADRLVFLRAVAANGRGGPSFSFATFEALRDATRTLSGITAYDCCRLSVTIDGQAEMVNGDIVTGSYFEVLGVAAAIGRLITPSDDRPGQPRVVVISDDYWARRFGRSTSVIGKDIFLAKLPFTIIGVTPRGLHGRELTGTGSEIVVPMVVHSEIALRDHTTVALMGRLKPGVTIDQVAADLTPVYRQALAAERVRGNFRIDARPGDRGESGATLFPAGVRQTRLIASIAVLVLLIGCLNVATLLAARSTARQREVAVRLAIGASRPRLVRQLVTESLVLALLGGAVGLLASKWTADLLVNVLPFNELSEHPARSASVWMVAIGLSLLTGVVFGVAPALAGTRVSFGAILKGSGPGRPVRHRLARTLVVAQVALSLMLLIGTGLLVRSLQRLYAVERGYDPEHALTTWVYPVLLGYDQDREMDLYQRLLDGLGATAGIQSASFSRVALGAKGGVSHIAPRFFETLDIPFKRGRDFTRFDSRDAPRVVILSQTAAKTIFPGEDAVGKPIPDEYAPMFGASTATIVGVVGDVRRNSRQATGDFAMYAPYTQAPIERLGQMMLYVRTVGRPAAMISAVRHTVGALDPDLALANIHPLTDDIDNSVSTERSTTALLGGFGAMALVLACIGLYGTMSHSVAQRAQEIGIRMSLGAGRAQVVAMIVRDAMTLVVIGIAIGVPAAIAASRLITNLLFGVAPTDVASIGAAAVVMVLVALAAGWPPARRASRVDPIATLRAD